MRKTTNTVNTASKDVLAKAMAMEGITVQHSADAETAWFNVENRTLCLPVWNDMTNDIYDMLVGHEVSHALHTPADAWSSWIGKDQFSGVRHQFLNIVEDARIERLIKDKFPGLRRNFANAYKSFKDRDMFEIEGKNISELPLIDRLNIEFKLGLYGHADVEFSTDEQQFVQRMKETSTIENVQDLANDLFERWLDEQPEQQPDNEQSEESEQGDSESGDGQDSSGQSNDDTGEEQDGSQSGSESNDEDTDTSESTDGAGDDAEQQQQSQDSGQSMNDDTDDGESADSEQGNEGQSGLGHDDYSNEPSVGQTQQSFDKAMQNMRDDDAGEYKYHTLPKMKVDEIVVSYKRIADIWEKFEIENADRIKRNDNDEVRLEGEAFIRKSRPVVNHMVQQFMMKQAAEVAKKTEIAKTGILDTVSMINYRWSEDIFVKNEVHEDGQSHGIVMYLDWSGSMCDILKETVEQLLVLTEFCNKMNIPFEVYSFTSSFERRTDGKSQFVSLGGDNELTPGKFHLLNFLSSKMSNLEYKKAVSNLWLLAESQSHNYNKRTCVITPSCFRTGCTPLNEAIITAYELIPAFQKQNDVQIVNAVFLTDGDGSSIGARSYGYGKDFVVEPKTRRNHEVKSTSRYSGAGETATYLKILKNLTGANIIGIKLTSARDISNLRYRYCQDANGNNDDKATEVAAKNYKQNNFFNPKNCEGHDELFIIKGNTKIMTNALEELDNDASLAKVRNAFVKGNNSKKTSRVIASRIIDIIAA